jgi:hypothetical protein
MLAIFPSPAGMSLTKLPMAGNNLIIPGHDSWDWKIPYHCYSTLYRQDLYFSFDCPPLRSFLYFVQKWTSWLMNGSYFLADHLMISASVVTEKFYLSSMHHSWLVITWDIAFTVIFCISNVCKYTVTSVCTVIISQNNFFKSCRRALSYTVYLYLYQIIHTCR